MRPYLIGYKHIIDLDKVVQVKGPFRGDEFSGSDKFTIYLEGGYEIVTYDLQYSDYPKYIEFMRKWMQDEEFKI